MTSTVGPAGDPVEYRRMNGINAGTFCLTVSPGSPPELEVDGHSLERKDVDYASRDGIEALVLGYPYVDGPRWLDASELVEWMREGEYRPERIHGFYAIVLRDNTAGRSICVTDRWGGYKLFEIDRHDGTFFSDSVEELAARAGHLHLDRSGILEFLNYGFMFGGTTHFEEIRKVPPATEILCETAVSATRRAYWRFGLAQGSAGPVDPDTAASMFEAHVRDLFELVPRASLPMTGGLDSRSILAACTHYPERVRCFSYGDRSNRDLRMARRICGKAGIPHASYILDRAVGETLPGDALRDASDVNGMVNFIVFSNLRHAYRSEGRQSDGLLTGIGAEIFRAYILKEKRGKPIDPSLTRARTAKKYKVNPLPELFLGMDEEALSREISSAISDEFDSFGLDDPAVACEAFFLHGRISNFALYTVFLAGRYLRLCDTWLYDPLVGMAPLVPLDDRVNDIVHRRVVKRNSEVLADVPLANGEIISFGAPSVRALTESGFIRSRDFLRKGVNKVARLSIRREPIKPDYRVDYTRLLSHNYPDLIVDTLDYHEMFLAPLIDPVVLGKATDALLRGLSGTSYVVTNLMCLELWLKRVGKLARISHA